MPILWRLREVLDEKDMTALQLAKALGVKHPTIYRLVRQQQITRITADMLDRLCAALDCQPGDLLRHVKRLPARPSGQPAVRTRR